MMLKGVKVEDTGNYVVQIPTGDYEVDGSNLKLEGYGSKELQVKDIDSIYKIESNRVSVGFTDGSVDVSVEEYEALREALPKPDEDGVWGSLEDEFQTRKFNRKWSTIYETRVNKSGPIPVALEVVKIDTGSKYITSMLCSSGFGKMDEKTVMVTLQRSVVCRALINELALKYDIKVDLPTHGGNRYIKVGGSYLFKEDKYSSVFTGTLEMAREQLDVVQKGTEEAFLSIVAKEKGLVIAGEASLIEIQSMLSSLRSSISSIEPKQKTYNSHRQANSKIAALTAYVDKALVDNLKESENG